MHFQKGNKQESFYKTTETVTWPHHPPAILPPKEVDSANDFKATEEEILGNNLPPVSFSQRKFCTQSHPLNCTKISITKSKHLPDFPNVSLPPKSAFINQAFVTSLNGADQNKTNVFSNLELDPLTSAARQRSMPCSKHIQYWKLPPPRYGVSNESLPRNDYHGEQLSLCSTNGENAKNISSRDFFSAKNDTEKVKETTHPTESIESRNAAAIDGKEINTSPCDDDSSNNDVAVPDVNWKEFWDEEVQAKYYYNVITKEARWISE